jgi:hypothetical protein
MTWPVVGGEEANGEMPKVLCVHLDQNLRAEHVGCGSLSVSRWFWSVPPFLEDWFYQKEGLSDSL